MNDITVKESGQMDTTRPVGPDRFMEFMYLKRKQDVPSSFDGLRHSLKAFTGKK